VTEQKGVEILGGSKRVEPTGTKVITNKGEVKNEETTVLDKRSKQQPQGIEQLRTGTTEEDREDE
jgi:hypothetical protein